MPMPIFNLSVPNPVPKLSDQLKHKQPPPDPNSVPPINPASPELNEPDPPKIPGLQKIAVSWDKDKSA